MSEPAAEEGVPPNDGGSESEESGFGDSDDESGAHAEEMAMMSQLAGEGSAREGYKRFLATVPLLAEMAATDLDRVADMVTAVTFADGEAIITQGEEGDSMYIVQEGNVAAEISGMVVKVYKSTEYFGEVALVRDGNTRAATVKSVGSSTCLRLGKKPFAIVLASGSIGDKIRRHVAVLLGEIEDVGSESEESGFGDSDDESGAHAEEMAMMSQLAGEGSAREGYKRFLATVPLLAEMAATDLDRVADMVTAVTFADGEAIIEQDAIGDTMYFLQAGEASVYLNQSPGNAVDRYQSGDFFGEVALSRNDLPRQATVKAAGDATCLRLGRKPFAVLLEDGKVGKQMKQHIKEKYDISAEVAA